MECPYCKDKSLENHSKDGLISCFRQYLEDSTPMVEPSQKQMMEYMGGLGYIFRGAEEKEYTEKEIRKTAQHLAQALTTIEGKKCYVHGFKFLNEGGNRSKDVLADFDISFDGVDYDGGSYEVRGDGKIKNVAVAQRGREYPVYAIVGDKMNTIVNRIVSQDLMGSASRLRKKEDPFAQLFMGAEYSMLGGIREEFKDAESNLSEATLKRLRKTYDNYEDRNEHMSNYMLLATFFGTDADKEEVKKIMARRNKRGYLTAKENTWLYENINPYYDHLRNVKAAETFESDEDLRITCPNCHSPKKMRKIDPLSDPYDPSPKYHTPIYYCLHCGGREGKMTTAQIKYDLKSMDELNPNWKEVLPIEKYRAETFEAKGGKRMYCPNCKTNRTWNSAFKNQNIDYSKGEKPRDFIFYVCQKCNYAHDPKTGKKMEDNWREMFGYDAETFNAEGEGKHDWEEIFADENAYYLTKSVWRDGRHWKCVKCGEIKHTEKGMPNKRGCEGFYEDEYDFIAEEFNVEFNEWADQEMLTHGQDISFRNWAKEEGEKHGDMDLTDWAKDEEESHDERYGAETFEAYDPMMQKKIDQNECKHRYDDGKDAWVMKYADLMGVGDGLSYIEAGVKCGICGQGRIGSWGINEREGFQITKGEEGRMPRFYGFYGAETFGADYIVDKYKHGIEIREFPKSSSVYQKGMLVKKYSGDGHRIRARSKAQQLEHNYKPKSFFSESKSTTKRNGMIAAGIVAAFALLPEIKKRF